MTPIRILLLLVICLAAGCTNASNNYSYSRYYDLGINSERRGDLQAARFYLYRSYESTLIGNGPVLNRPKALYEYSRISGYLGYLAEADKGFREVITMLDKLGVDPTNLRPPTYSEHSKLLFANERYADSIPVFAKAVESLDAVSAENRYPRDMAVFLTSYSKALRAIQENSQAEIVERRVERIRLAHPNAQVAMYEKKYILAGEISDQSTLPTSVTSSSSK